jgi:hypothetical protein
LASPEKTIAHDAQRREDLVAVQCRDKCVCKNEKSGTMSERRFQDIWKEQCEAARDVRERHGLVSALDYLVGEKLMTFAESASTRSEFACELPRFVAELKQS